MDSKDYWKSILKERPDLNMSPSSDVTLLLSDIRALVTEAFAAGQRQTPKTMKGTDPVGQLFDVMFKTPTP